MKELPAIETTYTELANILDLKLDTARQNSDPVAVLKIERQQLIHDSAYFILAWGQFEAKINEECEKAIRKRRQNPNWEIRRAWDAHDPERMRAKFEDRAALVLNRESTSSTAFRDTIRLYNERNRVAHGKSLASGIDAAAIISVLYQIASEIVP